MQRIKKKIYNYLLPSAKENKIKTCYITCAGRDDGLGAQLLSIFSVMLIAKQYNLNYAHTPFSFLLHSEGQEEVYENFFDLGKGEINIDQLDQNSLTNKYIKHPFEIKNKTNLLYTTQSCHQYGDKYPDNYLNIIDDIKSKFFYKFKDNYINYNNNEVLNIGLHIRRGDVSKDKNKIRFTDNTYCLNIVNNILKLIDTLNIEVKIHIYSQGVIEDFKEFKDYNVSYHLDECLLTTFYNLIESDILLMSKSTLSYCAGLLNENIVLYEPFWHSPLSKWNILDNNNLITEDQKLYKQIEDLIKSK